MRAVLTIQKFNKDKRMVWHSKEKNDIFYNLFQNHQSDFNSFIMRRVLPFHSQLRRTKNINNVENMARLSACLSVFAWKSQQGMVPI